MQNGHVEELYSPCRRCRRLCSDRQCKAVPASLLYRKLSVVLLVIGERSEHYDYTPRGKPAPRVSLTRLARKTSERFAVVKLLKP